MEGDDSDDIHMAGSEGKEGVNAGAALFGRKIRDEVSVTTKGNRMRVTDDRQVWHSLGLGCHRL
ncbi:MAG: hypothetical protein HWN71_06075 [Desulfobacterales bacterium]|nr:hypothetical protein [Desulfobacterales bacterium]